MPRSFADADAVHRALNNQSAPESPLYTLEIKHAQLQDSIRVVADNDDWPYGAAYQWQPGAAVAKGDVVVPFNEAPHAGYNGFFYEAETDGVTHDTRQPAWPRRLKGRIDDNNVTWVCKGLQYKAFAFRCRLPDDLEEGVGGADIIIDNVSRELMVWLEATQGGKDAEVTLGMALRSQPDALQWTTTMDMQNVMADMQQITARLSYTDLLNKPAVRLTMRPDNTPNIF